MNLKRNIVFLIFLTVFLILEINLSKYNIKPVIYTNYKEEDYVNEIIYSAKKYCLTSNDFGGAKIDFSNYNNELNLDFNAPEQGIVIVNTNCEINIKKDIVINNKTCNYEEKKVECK